MRQARTSAELFAELTGEDMYVVYDDALGIYVSCSPAELKEHYAEKDVVELVKPEWKQLLGI